MKIRVGGATAVDIQKGDEFEYDGSILKYTGMEIPSPQLRGAIENGWASLNQSDAPSMETIRPNRSIAKSKSVNKDLNRVQRSEAPVIETSSQDEDEVLKVSDRNTDTKAPRVLKQEDNRKSRGMSINDDMESNQDGVSIGRVKTSAKAVFDDVQNPSAVKKIAELENLSHVRANLHKRVASDDRVVEKEGVSIKTNVGSMSTEVLTDDDEEQVVAKVRTSSKTSSEGISIQDTSNVRSTPSADKKKSSAVREVKISDPRIRVARAIDPNFPMNWDFTGKLAERLDRVKAHGATSSFLEALFAAEGDQMRKVLLKEYPKQFS